MLTIRKFQMEVFQDDRAEKQICDFFCSVERCYPETAGALGRDGIREWVEEGRKAAQEKGVQSYVNVQRYLHLMFLLNERRLGETVETAWVNTILGWEDAGEDIKFDALEKRARAEMIERLQRAVAARPADIADGDAAFDSPEGF